MDSELPNATQQGTRTRLLQTSLATFAHRDFEAVSIREIVEQAGANIAAISYHFGGKQGLFECALQDYRKRYIDRIVALLEGPGAGLARRVLLLVFLLCTTPLMVVIGLPFQVLRLLRRKSSPA